MVRAVGGVRYFGIPGFRDSGKAIYDFRGTGMSSDWNIEIFEKQRECVKNRSCFFNKSNITQNYPKIIYIGQQLKKIINN